MGRVAAPRQRLRRLLLALAAGLLPLLLAELALRVFDPFHSGELLERERFAAAVLSRDEAGTLRLRPGARARLLGNDVAIGAQGWRNPPVLLPKPAGTCRVLVIGDSVAFGWGVAEDEAFPRVVERLLAAAGWPGDGRRVEVVNAGVPGWGAPNELVFLRDEGLGLEPDLVLVTLVNNDLTDVLEVLSPTADPPPLVLPGPVRATYLGRAVQQALAAATGRTGRPDFFLTLDLAPEPVERASALLCEAFAAMQALCGGRPFAVIDTVGTTEGWRLEPFVRCAAAAGIPRIEAYLGSADYRARYSVAATDDHPNAAGHRAMAEPIAAWVQTAIR
jgi:lysophospholipase L1-like esterase